MAQLTAVDWFFAEVLGSLYHTRSKEDIDKILRHAKQIEKEQIINAHTNGQAECDTEALRQKVVDNAEQYYNERYGTK